MSIMSNYSGLLVTPYQKELTRVWEDKKNVKEKKNNFNDHKNFVKKSLQRKTIDYHNNTRHY